MPKPKVKRKRRVIPRPVKVARKPYGRIKRIRLKLSSLKLQLRKMLKRLVPGARRRSLVSYYAFKADMSGGRLGRGFSSYYNSAMGTQALSGRVNLDIVLADMLTLVGARKYFLQPIKNYLKNGRKLEDVFLRNFSSLTNKERQDLGKLTIALTGWETIVSAAESLAEKRRISMSVAGKPRIGPLRGPSMPWVTRPPTTRFAPVGIDALKAAGPRYMDPYTGVVDVYGLRQARARQAGIPLRTKKTSLEDIAVWIPVFGPLISITKTIKVMGETGVTGKGVAFIVLDIAFAGLDAHFVVSLARTSATRALRTGKIDRRVALTAFNELDGRELKAFFNIARAKGGFRVVARELSGKTITANVLKEYIKKNKRGYLRRGAAWVARFFSDIVSPASRAKYRASVVRDLAREIYVTSDQAVIKELINGMKTLIRTERRIASRAIFSCMTTFSRKPQRALAALVRQKGWRDVINSVKSTRGGLDTFLKTNVRGYEFAARSKTLMPLVKTAAAIGVLHTAFIYTGRYYAARTERMKRKIKAEMELMAKREAASEKLEKLFKQVTRAQDGFEKGITSGMP